MAWTPEPPDLDKRTPEAAAWLEHVAETTFAEYSEWFTPDGCILATKVFVGVLKELGVANVDGISVCELILNPVASKHVADHDCDPGTCRKLRQTDGALVRALGGRPAHGAGHLVGPWGGHLIANVCDTWAADLTLSQANDPANGMRLNGTLVYPTGYVWMRGRGRAIMQISDDGQPSILMYAFRHWPADEEWRRAADWQESIAVQSLIGGTLMRLAGGPRHKYPMSMQFTRARFGRL